MTERICSIPGCGIAITTGRKFLCEKHYARIRRHGDPNKMTKITGDDLAARLWPRVIKGDGCWPWTGATLKGYGQLRFKGKTEYAHRIAWILTYGPIPDGLDVLHRCDNPPCCNPADLFLGTQADNTRDMVAKGRHAEQRKTHCKWGHEFTEANIYRSPTGSRQCRTCRRDRQVLRVAKRRQSQRPRS